MAVADSITFSLRFISLFYTFIFRFVFLFACSLACFRTSGAAVSDFLESQANIRIWYVEVLAAFVRNILQSNKKNL